MKIYLSSALGRKQELCHYREVLREAGHEITSNWLYDEDAITVEHKIRTATIDIQDIQRSEALVIFTEERSVGYTTGGRHVELGVGLALLKRIFIIGPKENVFMHLPHIVQFSNINELLSYLSVNP